MLDRINIYSNNVVFRVLRPDLATPGSYLYNAGQYYTWKTASVAASFSQVAAVTTTFTVTLTTPQPNTNYQVSITPTSVIAAAPFYVTNKTTTSFDVEYLAGLIGTVEFDWILIPQ